MTQDCLTSELLALAHAAKATSLAHGVDGPRWFSMLVIFIGLLLMASAIRNALGRR